MPPAPLSPLVNRRWLSVSIVWRVWRIWMIAAVIVFALALATRALPGLRARSLPTGRAEWIWRPIDRLDHSPSAFYAVRDFSLNPLVPPPARARLLVTADEEYVLTLNGQRIGAGAFVEGAPLDVYEVGPLLLPGGNRLLVELRSARGVGGLLASLVDEANGRQILGTDESWRIFPRHEPGLPLGWVPIGNGTPALSWGIPPVGRWGMPKAGKPRPLLTDAAGSVVPAIPAVTTLPFALPAGLNDGGSADAAVLYDWGQPVEGFLTLGLEPVETQGTALLFTGEAPPDPLKMRPTAAVLIQPGRREWMDARPRRFRYALLVGLGAKAAAAVLPAPARPAMRSLDGEVFGIQGPPLRTPVEDEVWSKLQRLPGVAGRKEL